ncbi:hypothetical protein DDB_G0292016 [Dictyostelium discoideum AX4]|uniref:von Willebrand factor A domain-containing protein DDB_G0292016 n=1 Tax=Dictyostelium discoideum TaxID=44689 RepID=Y2016_DICDI|nr:hypothetical protein DDB_G0292016 [Dictyostelium discoideum AX4]Q54DV3.1 RecName: Full=von Willebrand factor A domain-containing protein DDB_G0292016 [Dictyostelium discoideum]EAL61364.1 hypothetical protein DDB_G0292016 [Dictyostelium discoideum AX4]|eukprot:XP_629769.1 hypothetical protein DDB_G0292016 [Dictyostelium discoideum AX4]
MFSSITSKLSAISGGSSKNDYKEANYYNYFRILEKKQTEEIARKRCGLYSLKNHNNVFVLKEFSIETEINDCSSTSIWTQSYSNDSNTPVEAKYQLPLHPTSVVSNFQIEYQGKVIQGKIKEKEKALEKYNDAIASGGQAFMATKSDDGYFNLTLGNLPPKENVKVRVVISSELGTHTDGQLHYCLHRYMFPSYAFNFNYNVVLKFSIPIKSIDCDGFDVNVNYKENSSKKEAKITSKSQHTSGVKKNIILIIQPVELNEPKSMIEYIGGGDDKSYATAINFYPSFKNVNPDEVYQKSEFIFLIDCSGSMSGQSINKARRAMEIIIRSLNEQHKVNIYCFGSSFNKVFDKSRVYNDETLEIAGSFVEKISANLGGTELLPPMVDILSSPNDPEYPRQVFILTDGEISERDKLIDYVAKEANTTRIFTYGIGASVDQELVIGLSKACKGYYEMIKETTNMEKQVMKLLNVAFEPMLSNIKLDWSSCGLVDVIQAPSHIRPLFNQERMMIYSMIPSNQTNQDIINASIETSKPLIITLTGDGPKGNVLSFPITLDFKNDLSTNSNQIHTLAAFKHIQDLEESERKEKKDNKDKIVELGKKYGLVSKHTSYIVTADSDNVTEETMKTVDIMNQSPPIRPGGRIVSRGGGRSGASGALSSSILSRKRSSSPSTATKRSSSSSFSSSYLSLSSSSQKKKKEVSRSDDDDDDEKIENCVESYESDGGDQSSEQDEEEEDDCDDFHEDLDEDLGATAMDVDKKECEKECKKKDSSKVDLKVKPSKVPLPSRSPSVSKPTTTSLLSPSPKSAPSAPSQQKSVKSTGDLLIDLLKIQKSNGSWTKSSIDQLKIPTDKAPAELSTTELNDIWVTIIVIAKIVKFFSSEKAQYELAIQKSTRWVKLQLSKLNLPENTFDKFLSNAKSLV